MVESDLVLLCLAGVFFAGIFVGKFFGRGGI